MTENSPKYPRGKHQRIKIDNLDASTLTCKVTILYRGKYYQVNGGHEMAFLAADWVVEGKKKNAVKLYDLAVQKLFNL